ncbi:SagB/ThcOx family dehydrogenase [Deltaproteobacteria bacterium TL4]
MDHAQSVEQIFNYHEATKHHPHKYANSLGYLDWNNQPNPFRFYRDCRVYNLPFPQQDPQANHLDLFLRNNNQPRAFTLENISGMIELSLGLSAWKTISSSKWALRMNPSSGNLHPTESYWILPGLETMPGGLYHYNPLFHALENRALLEASLEEQWRQSFASDGVLCALSSIFWRESWKYGERAFRYCNHDTGHALAAISIAANLMGWHAQYIHTVSDKTLSKILGFDLTQWTEGEQEEVELLCWISPQGSPKISESLSTELISKITPQNIYGTPEVLSQEVYHWNIIEKIAVASQKPDSSEQTLRFPAENTFQIPASPLSASQIIRKRRSAVAFDLKHSLISREHFFGCIQATFPQDNCAPFDVELIQPSIHLFIFVHYVKGVEPGLYLFIRNPDHYSHLKEHTHADFLWEIIEQGIPFYLLKPGNWRQSAIKLSCQQEIAGDSAFSLGMVAHFQEVIEKEPFRYRHLFWEAGMIGQVLYLQAEAYGLRGTGIGCFLDDEMHSICGFKDNTYQSLYHFTIGCPLEDSRISTLPPYNHLTMTRK